MAGLKVVPVVNPGEVLALLNLKPVDPETFLKVQRYFEDSVSSNRGSSTDVKQLLRRLDVSQPAEFERRIIATKLLQYVDEWLETGWTEDGGESPERRSLIKAPLAMNALQDYASKQNPRLRFLRVPPEFVVEVGSSGERPHTSVISPFNDSIERVRREVARLFFGLITSDWGPHLSKCRYCGRYFVHPKPRPWYKHGTFCDNHHQMSWNAIRRGKETRHLLHSALLDIAATELMKRRVNGPHWQDDRPRKIQLANDISARVQKKWQGGLAERSIKGQIDLGHTQPTGNREAAARARFYLASRGSGA